MDMHLVLQLYEALPVFTVVTFKLNRVKDFIPLLFVVLYFFLLL